MKKSIIISSIAAVFALAGSAQAQSWGFTLGNGSGFYYNQGRQACAPVYAAPNCYRQPAPVYYQPRPVVYYQPQTVYMQPYQQMQPVYQPQRVIYRSEPVVIHEDHYRCRDRAVIYPNRW